MNFKKIAALAAVLGTTSLFAQTKVEAPIQTVASGTGDVTISLSGDPIIIYEGDFETSGLTINKIGLGSAIEDPSLLYSVTPTVGNAFMLMDDGDMKTFDGEFLKINVTLTGQVGTLKLITTDGTTYEDWTEAEIEPITITVVSSDYALSTNGYSTFSSANATKVTGATAYYVKVDGDVAKFTAVENNVVPANTGVVLKGTEGDVVTFAPNAEVAAGDCDLTACVSGATVEKNTVHVLATKDGQTGFYLYNGASIGAGKAYLEGSTAARIVFDEETGINDINAEQNVEAIFNLQGQKMTEAKKGINIVNGKKVMF